jgi:hypothetical protein
MRTIQKTSILLAMSVSALLLFSQCSGGGKNGTANNNPANVSDTTATTATTTSDNSNTATLAVRPPLKGVDVAKTSHKINGAKGGKIELPSGTVITIAPNIFVDKDGKPITDDVEILYREMHDAADILVSGIPIHRPNGEFMETAGMFEIEGNYQGQEIFVAEGKNINVKMASFNEGNRFDFWKMNPKDCSWTDIDGKPEGGPTVAGVVNKLRQDALAQLQKSAPTLPIRPTNPKMVKNPVFDLEANYTAFPELAAFKGIVWEYAGDNIKENPDKNDWVYDIEWETITISRMVGNNEGYKISLEANNSKKFVSTVRPVLSEKDYAKAIVEFDKKMDQYKNIGDALKAKKEAIERQAAVYREIGISGFGVYNWDCMNGREAQQREAELQFTDANDSKEIGKTVQLYLVSKNRKALLPLSIRQEEVSKKCSVIFYFSPKESYEIIAIINNERIAKFSQQEFEAVVKDNKTNPIVFKSATVKMNSTAEIRGLLNS